MLLLSYLNIASHSGKSSVTSKEKEYWLNNIILMDLIPRQYTQLQEKIWAQNKLKLKDDFVFNRLVPPNP